MFHGGWGGGVLGIELGALSCIPLHPFETGSRKVAQAGLELMIPSLSQPPEYLGLHKPGPKFPLLRLSPLISL